MAVIWVTGVVFVSFDWNMLYLGKRPLTIGSLPNPQDPVDLLFQFGWIDYQVVHWLLQRILVKSRSTCF